MAYPCCPSTPAPEASTLSVPTSPSTPVLDISTAQRDSIPFVADGQNTTTLASSAFAYPSYIQKIHLCNHPPAYTLQSSHLAPAHPISAAAYTASGSRLVFSLARCVACATAKREEDVRAGMRGSERALDVYQGCEMEARGGLGGERGWAGVLERCLRVRGIEGGGEGVANGEDDGGWVGKVDLFPESDADGSEGVKWVQSLEERERELWRADGGVRVGPFGNGVGVDAIWGRRNSVEWQRVWKGELEKRDSVIADMNNGDDGPADANPNKPDEQQQQVNPSPPASPSRPQHRASTHLSVPDLHSDQEKNTPDSKFSSDSSETSTTSRQRKGMLRKMKSWLKTKRTQDESSAPTPLKDKMPKDVWRRRSEGVPYGNTESATERARTFPGFP